MLKTNSKKAIENIIVEPNTVIDCNFDLSFGYGAIKNNSNTLLVYHPLKI